MSSIEKDLSDRMVYILMLQRRVREEEMEKAILGPLAVAIYEKGVGRHIIIVKDEKTKKKIEKYLDTVENAIMDGDGSYLAPYIATRVEDSEGKKHTLETDLKEIMRFLDEGYEPDIRKSGA